MSVWDTQMSGNDDKGKDFPVLPEGDYSFEVTGVTGKEYNPKPGAKMSKCAQIELKLRVESPDLKDKDVTVFDSLFSDPKMIWKMTQFAKATGIFHEGMTPSELMRQAEGAIGWVHVYVDEYQGQKRNRVTRYIVKDPVPEKPTSAPDDLPF